MKKIFVSILLFITFLGFADNEGLQKFAKAVAAQESETSEIKDQYKELYKVVQESTISEQEKLYELAFLDFYMAKWFLLFSDTETAKLHYNEVKTGRFSTLLQYYSDPEKIREYLTLAETKIEQLHDQGYQPTKLLILEAGVRGDLVLINDIPYLLGNGLKPVRIYKKVLKTDEQHMEALYFKAASKTYPPKIWGGNQKKAISILDQLSSNKKFKTASPVLKNNVFTSYALCYGKLEQYEKAREFNNLALSIFPQNIFSLAIKEQIAAEDF